MQSFGICSLSHLYFLLYLKLVFGSLCLLQFLISRIICVDLKAEKKCLLILKFKS